MKFVVLSDIHGDYKAVDSIMEKEEEIELFLCAGDVVDVSGDYWTPPKSLYFLSGNHEAFDIIERLDSGELYMGNFFHIKSGEIYDFGDFTLAGLNGNFAPSKYYKPPPKGIHGFDFRDGRRHFHSCDVEKIKTLGHVDILLTHEPPIPYKIRERSGKLREAGIPMVNEIKEKLTPIWHFYGHHHRKHINGNSICMPYPRDGHVVIDTKTFNLEWK